VSVLGFEGARHALVEKTWPFLCEGARNLRSATKERGMRIPDLGETHAHIRDEDVEQFLRSRAGSAFSLVSYELSYTVLAYKFNHNGHPPSLDAADNGDLSAFVMPDEMPLCQFQ